MTLPDLLNSIYIALAIAFFGAVAYMFYAKPKFKALVLKVLPFLPALLRFVATKVPDKEGEFDTHDVVMLSSRVLDKFLAVLRDESNRSLADLKVEVRDEVLTELAIYRNSGVKNVPEVGSEDVDNLVDLIFANIEQLLADNEAVSDEDSPRDDQ